MSIEERTPPLGEFRLHLPQAGRRAARRRTRGPPRATSAPSAVMGARSPGQTRRCFGRVRSMTPRQDGVSGLQVDEKGAVAGEGREHLAEHVAHLLEIVATIARLIRSIDSNQRCARALRRRGGARWCRVPARRNTPAVLELAHAHFDREHACVLAPVQRLETLHTLANALHDPGEDAWSSPASNWRGCMPISSSRL